MIEFCEGRYITKRDKYQWILTEHSEGKDRHGNVKARTRETFHATLDQVCNEVVERECGKCDSLQDLVALLWSAKDMLAVNARLQEAMGE